jgi:PAS domain S-box-containing protein
VASGERLQVTSAPGPDAALLTRLVHQLPAMVAYWDAALRCRFANQAYELWFGVSAAAMVGQDMRTFLGPLFDLNRPYVEGVLRGETQAFERDIPDPAGGPPRASQAHYIPDLVDGVVVGFGVLVTDITPRKQAEAAVRALAAQAHANERLRAMATLAAGLGHELNNPLAALLGTADHLLAELDRGHVEVAAIQASLLEVRASAGRLRDIVGNLRDVVGGEGDAPGARVLGPGTVFETVLPADAAVVLDRPGQGASRARLLIIDDEVSVGRTLQRLLAREHEVEVLHDGRAAVARLTSAAPPIDLVLCDLMMPAFGGKDVYAEVVARQPALTRRFIFMTGGIFTPDVQAFLDGASAPLLTKPFDLPRILAVIAGQLARLDERAPR